ncbi:CRIB domain-containing protein RIC5 [Carica papaya]|uniref:CRIB domain-containing protein RIC5 n=1 Tax=Carica papaya TaxID=3649 RepID=UPI000B8CAA43|nr:CRIB domain-containing protein RIC5 [Carica papaya]
MAVGIYPPEKSLHNLSTPVITMKGFLKGLRYFTHIFEEEKEPEMQIGFPTDVKHVAHIGWDGPSANSPSWMGEFKGPELSTESLSSGEMKHNPPLKLSSEGINGSDQNGLIIHDSSSLPPIQNEKQKHKSRRKSSSTGNGSPLNSPTRRSSSDAPKQSRRSRGSNISMDSPSRDPSSRHARRQHHSSGAGTDSPSHDPPAIPKHSRHKKSKGSTGDDSTKSSRSKDSKDSDDCSFNGIDQ